MGLFRPHLTTALPIPKSTLTSLRASRVMASTSTPSTTRSVSAATTSRWLSGGTESRRPVTMRAERPEEEPDNQERYVRRAHDQIVKVGYGERFPQYRCHWHRDDDRSGNRCGDHVEDAAGRAKWDSDPRRSLRRGVRPAG